VTLLSVILLVLKISIVLSVFALGLNATFSDMTYLFRHPAELVRAALSMYVLMPLLAIAILMTFHLHPAVKVAIGALALSPVPPIFPRMALNAGGRDDYSVGLLVAASVLGVVITPIVIGYFEHLAKAPLEMPARSVAALVITTILIPLLLGIAVRDAAPMFAEQIVEPVSMWAAALLILSALPVLIGSMPLLLSLISDGTLMSFAAFAVAGYLIGDTLGRPDSEKRQVLGLATATRHPAIAAAIAYVNFPAEKLAVPAIVLYLIVSGVITGLVSRQRPRPSGLPSRRTEKRLAA
jgi:bile acid:Na+ symporter, BASS family